MIALHPSRIDGAAALAALASELAILRQMHALLNEEERALAPQAGGSAEAASQAIAALAVRRAQLAQQLQAATLARNELFKRHAGPAPATANAQAITAVGKLREDAALQRTWRAVHAAYTQIARRHRAHTHTMQRYSQYLQSRWNGLMQSAGQARAYDRNGGASGQRVRASMLVSA